MVDLLISKSVFWRGELRRLGVPSEYRIRVEEEPEKKRRRDSKRDGTY